MDDDNNMSEKHHRIKELEAKLKAEKEQNQDLLQIIGTLDSQIFRCQRSFENEYIITFNEGKIAELNNLPTRKIGGKRMREILGEEFYLQLEPYHEKAFNGEAVRYRGFEYNGRIYSVEVAPFKRDENGKVIETVGIAQEITQQYQTEQDYQREKEILDRIIEYNPYSIQILDADGYHLRENKSFLDLFKTQPDKNWTILKDPLIDQRGLSDTLNRMLKGEVIKTPPFWYNAHDVDKKYPDNPICIGSVIFPIFLSSGKLENIVVMHENITERTKAKEELILAKEKAEESDRLKSAFLANLSHEIRTPMNGIFGFTELLREKNINEKEKNEYIDIIKDSGNRMMNIIEDLVSISKIESGQMQLAKEKTNINELMEYLYQLFDMKIDREVLELGMDIENSGYPFNINTDKDKLYAVISNLLKNAIRFTEQGYIDFGYQTFKDKGVIQFYVKDTGRGISPAQQHSIFKRFVQVDTSLSRNHEGTGLGLSIAQAYVEMLGGEIWVDSEKEKGSTFYFTIPLEMVDQENLPSNKEETVALSNKIENATILITDDDEVTHKYFEDILKDKNVNILIAKTGKEAIELCKQHRSIQLVFMDIRMPVMDGYTAAQYIKETKPEMPIVAQTAFALEKEKKEFGDIFDEYITKPVGKNTLLRTLNHFLSSA